MKVSKILIIMLILIGGSLIVIKIYQNNKFSALIQSLIAQDPNYKMLKEDQELINRVITLCDGEDDMDTFTAKAWSIWEDKIKWAQQYGTILKEKPELANQIDEQWMELILTLGSSITNDSSELERQKKATAMELIGRNIKPETLVNYFKNKSGVNQEALNTFDKLHNKK